MRFCKYHARPAAQSTNRDVLTMENIDHRNYFRPLIPVSLVKAIRLGFSSISTGFSTIADSGGAATRRRTEARVREYLYRRTGRRSMESFGLYEDQMRIGTYLRNAMPSLLSEARVKGLTGERNAHK